MKKTISVYDSQLNWHKFEFENIKGLDDEGEYLTNNKND